ncbi:MAG: DUF5668 domain-containing protein [Candidatus Acidoferrales bacterium]
MSEGATPSPQPPAPAPAPPYRFQGTCSCARCRCRGLLGPIVLITVGAVFLAGQLLHSVGFGELWPIILIVIGVVKLLESTASIEGHRG